MSRTFRAADLCLIAGGYAALAVGLWFAGSAVGSPILQFIGFMAGASTFVPLPADAYVLSVADDYPALTIGLVGGAVNAAAVLVEREWVMRLVSHPVFTRFQEFVGTNRYVGWAENHLFVGLVVGGFSFLPFEPFRLVAILRNYSPVRYAFATFVGRGVRYYCYARVGRLFAVYGLAKWVVWASLALFAVGLVRSYFRFQSTGSSGQGVNELEQRLGGDE